MKRSSMSIEQRVKQSADAIENQQVSSCIGFFRLGKKNEHGFAEVQMDFGSCQHEPRKANEEPMMKADLQLKTSVTTKFA